MNSSLEVMAQPLRDYLADKPGAGIPDIKVFQKEYIRQTKVERGLPPEERTDLSQYPILIDNVVNKLNGE